MKILRALLLASCVATAAQAAPPNPDAVNEFTSQLTLANKGDRDAQYRVGEMYEKGLGTAQDLSLAIIWYGKASLQDDLRASNRLKALDRSKASDVKEKEQSRVDSVMKALRQQEFEEAARTRAARDKAAAETRERQQAQDAAARAREKAAADTAAAKGRSELAAAASVPTAKAASVPTVPIAKPAAVPTAPTPKPAPAPIAKPAEAPKKAVVETERAEFSGNPCKGPQAKFLSTCK